ncbi:MAG TPA: bifunctional DNA-formamidopyrimidine glycosylase/DNA-(apurinic or apyrimidinic site) lyase [Gaiellaceae bacterium]|nr:bifunctional DNA-formamidopyrimidine glycosylase/DNA-(apurinic or apyrimidinic site) lyase [Gaiellaceae bacterium]
MPELPEVETVRARLEPALVGRSFERVEIRDARLTRPFDPDEVAAELQGEVVEALERRGKYLVFRFRSGRVLLVHLRMTGTFRHGRNGTPDVDLYRRAVVRLDDGSDVMYRDVRRFGTWLLLEPDEEAPYLASRLGEEPLTKTFTTAALAARLRGRKAPLKAALLDQRAAAGMGNIYADEALWRAKIHPLRPAGDLSPAELRRLHRGINDAIRAGIARQGTTLRDYRTPDGASGSMQDELRVYGRGGEPCPRCGTEIAKTRAGGRGTWYCPNCQRSPI